jgi:hypothetical protein
MFNLPFVSPQVSSLLRFCKSFAKRPLRLGVMTSPRAVQPVRIRTSSEGPERPPPGHEPVFTARWGGRGHLSLASTARDRRGGSTALLRRLSRPRPLDEP